MPPPGVNALTAAWAEDIRHRLGTADELARLLAQRLARAIPRCQAAQGADIARIASLAELSAATHECYGRLDGADGMREEGTTSGRSDCIVCGWLRPLVVDGSAKSSWRPADAGTLMLSDAEDVNTLACSARDDCVPRPEQLGAFVVLSAWNLVPAAAGVTDLPYLEIDGPIIFVSHGASVPVPQIPHRTLTVDEAQRALAQRDAKRRMGKLMHVHGELTAISEPFGFDEPRFFVELASSWPATTSGADGEPGAKRARTGAIAVHDGMQGQDPSAEASTSAGASCCDGGRSVATASTGCATAILFVGVEAAAWRDTLRRGSTYLITNLRQCELDYGRGEEGFVPVLRSSCDAEVASYAESKTTVHLMEDAVASFERAGQAAAALLDHASLAAESQHWVGASCILHSQVVQSQVADEVAPVLANAEGGPDRGQPLTPPLSSVDHTIVHYVGVVTAWFSACLLELDGQYLLFLTHLQRRTLLGVRVGARVIASYAHPLLVPDEEAGHRVVGFGLCFRGSVRVEQHAPLRKLCFGPRHHRVDKSILKGIYLRHLGMHLTLPELAVLFDRLIDPGGRSRGATTPGGAPPSHRALGWSQRWEGIVGHELAFDALQRLLTVHGLHELRPPQPPASAAERAAGHQKTAADGSVISSARCCSGEFMRHAAQCRVGCIRAHVPDVPTLAQALGKLKALPAVSAAMRSVRLSRSPQLLSCEVLQQSSPSAPLPLLVGCLQMQEALSASQLDDRPLVLADASADVLILLPASEMSLTTIRGRPWLLTAYSLLIEPWQPHSPPTIYVWARLLNEPGQAPLALPLWKGFRPHPLTPPVPSSGGSSLAERGRAATIGGTTTSAAVSIREMVSAYTRAAASASPQRRPPASFNLRSMLRGRRLKDDGTVELALVDTDYAAGLNVYSEAGYSLPPGLLVGCTVLIHGVRVVTAARGGIYGKLALSSRMTVFRGAAHNLGDASSMQGAASPATPALSNASTLVGRSGAGTSSAPHASRRSDGTAASEGANLSQVAALTSSSPAFLCDVRPYGGPEAMLRLQVTVRGIYEMHLCLRCCACGDERVGPNCRCPPPVGMRAVGPSHLEAELKVDVTDGTGRAYMQCSGRTVWTALHTPPSIVNAVRAATETAGPLTCRSSTRKFECLSGGRGEWQCGHGMSISDEARRALDGLWPLAALWPREFEAHAMVGSRPAHPTLKHVVEGVAGESSRMLCYDPRFVTIVAYDLTPTAASVSLERVLEAGKMRPHRP